MRVLTAAVLLLWACGGGDDAKTNWWNCTCHGIMEAASGPPLMSSEQVTECSAENPEAGLSERYDAAAKAQGPEFSGNCDSCVDTGDPCVPEGS